VEEEEEEEEEEGKRFHARRNLAHGFLDGDESVVAVAIITTVELVLLGLVLFFTWHDTR
jgi:hypothetical protein